MVREMTKNMECPPAIYGHNGGITARTRHIYREVLDMFARLDGIDFRQTAPLTEGLGLLRPFGLEWKKCEEMLVKPMAGKPAVMIARAGGLDQGNIIQNLLVCRFVTTPMSKVSSAMISTLKQRFWMRLSFLRWHPL